MWFARVFLFLRAHVLVCKRHVAQGNECLLNTTQLLHTPGRSDYCWSAFHCQHQRCGRISGSRWMSLCITQWPSLRVGGHGLPDSAHSRANIHCPNSREAAPLPSCGTNDFIYKVVAKNGLQTNYFCRATLVRQIWHGIRSIYTYVYVPQQSHRGYNSSCDNNRRTIYTYILMYSRDVGF